MAAKQENEEKSKKETSSGSKSNQAQGYFVLPNYSQGYSPLVQILAQQQKRIYDEEAPWMGAGQLVQNYDFGVSRKKPWEYLGTKLVQGLLGGALYNYGKSSAKKKEQDLFKRFAVGLSQESPSQYYASQEDLSELAPYVGIMDAERNQELEKERRKNLIDLQQGFTKEGLMYDPQSGSVMGIPGYGEAKAGQKLMEKQAELEANRQAYQQMVPQGQTGSSSGFDFGTNVPSLDSEYDRRYRELIALGLPAGEAGEQASFAIGAKRKSLQSSYNKADKAREKATQLLTLADTAEAALSEIGPTGPYTGGPAKMGNDLLSPFNESMATRSRGYATLQSIAPEIVKMSRSPGAVTDYETKLYIGAGPNIYQTPESNQLLSTKLRRLGELEAEYADFLDTYREDKGTIEGADKAWQSYKKSYPLFVQQADGKLDINPNRPDWRSFFGQRGQRSAMPPSATNGASSFWGASPPQQGQATQQIPPGMRLLQNIKTGETRLVPK